MLWAFIGLLLVRGLADVVAGRDPERRRAAAGAVHRWPDDRVRAFAVQFAQAYLGNDRTREGRRALTAMFTLELRQRFEGEAPWAVRQRPVATAGVVAAQRLAPDRALMTVASTVGDGDPGSRYVVIPVARDERNGLAVFALPWFVPTPATADVTGPAPTTVDDDRLRELAVQFLTASLSGDRKRLAYLVPPGVEADTLPGLQLVDVIHVGQVQGTNARHRTIVVDARVKDRASDAAYELGFWIDVVRRDRWYATRLVGGGS